MRGFAFDTSGLLHTLGAEECDYLSKLLSEDDEESELLLYDIAASCYCFYYYTCKLEDSFIKLFICDLSWLLRTIF